MEKLIVNVEWCDKNYCACIELLGGLVVETNKNFEDLKKGIEEAIDFHIESNIEDGEQVPEFLVNKNYEIEYNLLPSAVLKNAQNFTTLAVISRVTGINERLLYQYANSIKKPRELQFDKILNGLKTIGNNIIAMT